jgi:hypothetical protein
MDASLDVGGNMSVRLLRLGTRKKPRAPSTLFGCTTAPFLWGADVSFFTINGFSNSNSICPAWTGLVLMRIRDNKAGDRQVATLLIAQSTGKKVRVSVDPSFVGSDGYCFLRWVSPAE